MQEHEAQGSSQTKITTADTGQFKALADLIRNDGFAMSFQSMRQYRQALIRVVENSAPQPAPDVALLDEIDLLRDQLDAMAEYKLAAHQLIGIPASVGISEPIEGFAKRPQDIMPAVRDMALRIELLERQAAEREWQRPLPMWSRMKAIYTAMLAAAAGQQGESVALAASAQKPVGYVSQDFLDGKWNLDHIAKSDEGQISRTIPVFAKPPQPAEHRPCPEDIREGAPYDDPAFESLCREHEIWGTAAAAQCAVFWEAGKRVAEQQPALTKYQPCGCVICTCEHETQCQGCGANHCGTHPVGQIPGPVYQQPAADVAKMQRKLEASFRR